MPKATVYYMSGIEAVFDLEKNANYYDLIKQACDEASNPLSDMLYNPDDETGERPKPIGNYHKIPEEGVVLLSDDDKYFSIETSNWKQLIWKDKFDSSGKILAAFSDSEFESLNFTLLIPPVDKCPVFLKYLTDEGLGTLELMMEPGYLGNVQRDRLYPDIVHRNAYIGCFFFYLVDDQFFVAAKNVIKNYLPEHRREDLMYNSAVIGSIISGGVNRFCNDEVEELFCSVVENLYSTLEESVCVDRRAHPREYNSTAKYINKVLSSIFKNAFRRYTRKDPKDLVMNIRARLSRFFSERRRELTLQRRLELYTGVYKKNVDGLENIRMRLDEYFDEKRKDEPIPQSILDQLDTWTHPKASDKTLEQLNVPIIKD